MQPMKWRKYNFSSTFECLQEYLKFFCNFSLQQQSKLILFVLGGKEVENTNLVHKLSYE